MYVSQSLFIFYYEIYIIICIAKVKYVLFLLQLRSFRIKFAEVYQHYATAAKLLEDEMSDKGASKSTEQQIIKVCVYWSW